jgi:hypothetical protein
VTRFPRIVPDGSAVGPAAPTDEPAGPTDEPAGPTTATRCSSLGDCPSLGARRNLGSEPERVPAPWFVHDDRGSVTPLVIGMLVCLLFLTAGVTAAGSAFLAGQRLQRLCDGAVAAAVGAVDPRRSSSAGVTVRDPIAAANQYLRLRGPDVGAVVDVGADTISARCSDEAPITFGVLFGSPTLARTVTSTSQPILRQGALGGGGGSGLPHQRELMIGPEGTSI